MRTPEPDRTSPNPPGNDADSVDTRIDRLLAEYLDQRQSGEHADIEELLAEIPPARHREFLDCLELVDAGRVPFAADPAAILPGRVIGGFMITGRLGRGGMAYVFEADQPSLARSIALKILRPALALDGRNRERFRREARSAARLSHPNIVPVYETGEDQGFTYLAMERIRGKSLAELLVALQSLPRDQDGLARAADAPELKKAPTLERALAGMLAPIADAIAHAHAAGILHRDIKPSNILVQSDGRLMVADFGLARGDTDPALSLTGEPLGTPYYMAPEQIEQASTSLDARTDVYSLGVTLYETLTGKRPFAGATTVAVFDAIRTSVPSRPRALQPDLSRDAEAVIERAMARDREDRYPSAAHLAEDLHRLANGEITEARRICGGTLQRAFSAAGTIISGRRYEHKSRTTLLGLPLVHVNTCGARSGERAPRARGWIAIGNKATGVLAIGHAAAGVVSVGILSIGLLSFAAAAGLGALSIAGGLSTGGVAVGGVSAGYVAVGGAAFGQYPLGGYARGEHPISGRGADPEGVRTFQRIAPWLVDALLPSDTYRQAGSSGPGIPPAPSSETDMIHPILAAALSLVPADAEAAPTVLENGIEAYVIHLPDAPKQGFFTFVPVGLASDPPDRAQFSHLAEHMMIRSTDPDGLMVGEVMLNGETGASMLRLESIAPEDEWETALSRHALWLATNSVDEETLAREKGRIAGEATSTVANGFTGKWALAAWNQVVRHGRRNTRLLGDVSDAVPSEVLAYLNDHVSIGAGVRIVAVGPAPADLVLAQIEAQFGSLTIRANEPAAAAADIDRAPGEATWDLDATSCLLYAPISCNDDADRAAMICLGQLLMMDLYQALGGASGRQVMVSTDIDTPEGRFLIASIGGVKPDQVEETLALLQRSADRVSNGELNDSAPVLAAQMVKQLLGPHDFEAIRGTLKGRPGADFIEVQATLTRFHTLLGAGIPLGDAAEAFREVDAPRVARLARAIAAGARRTLVLRPTATE